MADLSGSKIGNYTLTSCIGTGGFSEVYLGQHNHLPHVQVAIKILNTTNLSQEDINTFVREAGTIASLQHEHIVRFYDFSFFNNCPYIIMEYVPQGSLRSFYPHGTIVPLNDVLLIIGQVAEAIQFAHDNKVIHRDIKPENILVGKKGHLYLSDFGIVAGIHDPHSVTPQGVVGTWDYVAPEQLKGQACPASDQYAAAIMTYEWLCGKRPFLGNSQGGIIAEHLSMTPPPFPAGLVSPAVEDVVMTALRKEPDERFASITHYYHALLKANRQSLTQKQAFANSQTVANTTGYVPNPTSSSAARLRQAISGAGPTIFKGHTGEVTCVAVSPDGRRLASSSKDGSVIICDTKTGKQLLQYTKHKQEVNTLAWSPD